MKTINKFIVHHSGGVQGNPLASTKHHTFQDINRWHKQRWDWESKYIPNQYGGYNIAINPEGKWHQYRAIGEETAGAVGHNHDSIHICLIGNYTKGVNKVTKKAENTLKKLIIASLEGNLEQEGILVAKGTKLSIPLKNVAPHRKYGDTECYGTGLSDDYARNLAKEHYKKKIELMQKLVLLYRSLIDLLRNNRGRTEKILDAYSDN